MRNEYGEYVPGARSESTFRASVQPVSLEDVDAPEGARLLHRLKIYIPEPNALAAAFDEAAGDAVVFGGKEYLVEDSQSWPNHTKAIVLRQT